MKTTTTELDSNLQKTILLVAFHFPPDAGSTGRLRTLSFARHLPSFGWRPIVLAPKPIAYERTDHQGENDIPADLPVYRTPALDTRRHLGWQGKYWSGLATPDRWVSWWPGAVLRGLHLIRQQRVDVIWSTYPVGTTHLIGATLARASGLPWVADFRDPVRPEGTHVQRWAAWATERRTLKQADRVVFTTDGARQHYAERFPETFRAGNLAVVPNGYEESMIEKATPEPALRRKKDQPLHLVHSGLLYERGRNPGPFLAALQQLKASGMVDAQSLQVTLRASGHEENYQAEVQRLGVGDMVTLAAPIPYREALQEQANADGLLLFQGPEFNTQIPAKVFEYLCAAKPVFALTDPNGDTMQLLDEIGGALLAPIADTDAIAEQLTSFLQRLRSGSSPAPELDALRQYTRRACTQRFVNLLDTLRTKKEATP